MAETKLTDTGHARRALLSSCAFTDFTLPGYTKDAQSKVQDPRRGKMKTSKECRRVITNDLKKLVYEDRHQTRSKCYKKRNRKTMPKLYKFASGGPKKKKERSTAKMSKCDEARTFAHVTVDPNFEGNADHTLTIYENIESHRKELCYTEPMDCPLIETPLKRQVSCTFSSLESEIVSPSSASTLRFYRRAESSLVDLDMDTSDTGTPASLWNLQTAQQPEEVNAKNYTTIKLRLFLQRNYEYIKDELCPDGLADLLFSKEIITSHEREQISEEKFRAERSNRLIKSLVKNSLKTNKKNDEVFVKVVREAFKQEGYGYLFDQFDEIEEETVTQELPVDTLWKGKLSYFATNKGDELDALEVIDKLLAREVITFDEHQNILDIPKKQTKIDALIESVKQKNFKQFDKFCEIIKQLYPDASRMLDGDVYERMEISRVSEFGHMPVLEIDVLKESTRNQDLSAESSVKFTIGGVSDTDCELEQMVVDAHSPTPSEGLQALVMEDIHCGLQVSFSCIKITLSCLSERSRMLLMQKCKDSPNFLQRWIEELLDEEKMKMLLEKGHRKVNFKIQVNWPEFILTRRDIAQNYEYLKRKLEPKDYCNILKIVEGNDKIIKKILSEDTREKRCKEFIIYMVVNEHAPIEKLSAKLKETDILRFIKKKRQNCNSICTCKLTKRLIVDNFTMLEQRVERPNEIVKLFAEFRGFDSAVKSKFLAIKSTETSKTEALLRNILALPDEGLQVCLFEYALKETNQEELLSDILSKPTEEIEKFTITKDDISRNISFLQQELEPMRFVCMVSEQDGTAKLREKILEANSRRQRCTLFLDYLKESDKATMEKFTCALQQLHLTNIINCLLQSRQQGYAENSITKDDITQNMSFLKDILDPMELRHILTDNENDKSRKALDNVLSAPRKRRCKVFLDTMINAEENVFRKFTTYLEKQMSDVVKFLINARGQGDRKMRAVMESLLDTYSCIVEEIEPARLRNVFVDRQVITDVDFRSILSKPSRRSRAVALMAEVLNGPVSRAQCLMDSLESAGYTSLILQINKMREKFKPCQRLYRLELGADEYFAFEGKIGIIFEQAQDDEATEDFLMSHESDLDESIPLSRDKYDHIHMWLAGVAGACALEEISQPEKEKAVSDNQSTSERLKLQENDIINNCNGLSGCVHWSRLSDGVSSSFSQCRRIDETGDKCCLSVGRTNSVTTVEIESNYASPSPEMQDIPSPKLLNFDRVRNDLNSISAEYRGSEKPEKHNTRLLNIEQATPSPGVKSVKQKVAAVKVAIETSLQVCNCNLGSENLSQSDSKMGKCELHSLYYIK